MRLNVFLWSCRMLYLCCLFHVKLLYCSEWHLLAGPWTQPSHAPISWSKSSTPASNGGHMLAAPHKTCSSSMIQMVCQTDMNDEQSSRERILSANLLLWAKVTIVVCCTDGGRSSYRGWRLYATNRRHVLMERNNFNSLSIISVSVSDKINNLFTCLYQSYLSMPCTKSFDVSFNRDILISAD